VPERLVVIGGGYIGLELGTAWAKLGAKVVVVEATAGLLPGNDPELVDVVAKKLKKLGVEVMLEAKALGWEEAGGKARVKIAPKAGGEAVLDADAVLVCVGRRPNSENLGLDRIGVAVDRGIIKVDKKQRTSVAGVYAIGDVAGGPMLAHKATKEGEVAAEVIAGHHAEMDARAIPAVIFVDPEIATAGLSEAEAKAKGMAVKVGKFPFAAIGRALSTGESDGFVKIIADAASDQVLGVGIVGPSATDLISEAALAIEMGALLRDLSLTIHPHPTLGESIMETAKMALGEPIHMPLPRK
jgi:dihydrolipoamide dehydrogenase